MSEPQAFPSETRFGMTLRDYFAAKAMQSLNARPDYDDVSAEYIAIDAYTMADAMLEARKSND
jgi:hypothetical protein